MGEERTKNVANGVVPFRHGSRSLEINPWQSSSGTATNINPWLSSIEAAANINSWQLSFEAEPPQSDGHHLTSQFAWARKNKLMISSNSLKRKRYPQNKIPGGERKSGGETTDGEKRKSAGKATDENKNGPHEREQTKEQSEVDAKTSYVGVLPSLLYCHVCSERLWNSESFEKHIHGRPHALMMNYLNKSYKMRINYMRDQIKLFENQRRNIVLFSQEKLEAINGSSNASDQRMGYCSMCDVYFYCPFRTHNLSEGHMKLRQYLYDECKWCDIKFDTPFEMDKHVLSAEHMQNLTEIRYRSYLFYEDRKFDLLKLSTQKKGRGHKNQMPVVKKYEMLGNRDATKLNLELDGGSGETTTITLDDRNVENFDNEEKNGVKDGEENGSKEIRDDAKKEEEMEKSNVDSTAEDSIEDVTAANDSNGSLGKEFLVATKRYVCRQCNCFFPNKKYVLRHYKTDAHHIEYTQIIKEKEATIRGKKRGIDEVTEHDSNSEEIDAVNVDYGIDSKRVVSQEPTITDAHNIEYAQKIEVKEDTIRGKKRSIEEVTEDDGNSEQIDADSVDCITDSEHVVSQEPTITDAHNIEYPQMIDVKESTLYGNKSAIDEVTEGDGNFEQIDADSVDYIIDSEHVVSQEPKITDAHHIEHAQQIEVKEATIRGKKRGIDEVTEDDGNSDQIDADNVDYDNDSKHVVSQDPCTTESEMPKIEMHDIEDKCPMKMISSSKQLVTKKVPFVFDMKNLLKERKAHFKYQETRAKYNKQMKVVDDLFQKAVNEIRAIENEKFSDILEDIPKLGYVVFDSSKYNIIFKNSLNSDVTKSYLQQLNVMSIAENELEATIHFYNLIKSNWMPDFYDIQNILINWGTDVDTLLNKPLLERPINDEGNINHYNFISTIQFITECIQKNNGKYSSNDLLTLAKFAAIISFDHHCGQRKFIIKKLFNTCIEKVFHVDDVTALISFTQELCLKYTESQLSKMVVDLFLPIDGQIMKKMYIFLSFKLFKSFLGQTNNLNPFPSNINDWFVQDLVNMNYFIQNPSNKFDCLIQLMGHVVVVLNLYENENKLSKMHDFFKCISKYTYGLSESPRTLQKILGQWRMHLFRLNINSNRNNLY